MGTLEYRICPHGEVQMARIAAVIAALARRNVFLALAFGAGCAVLPEAAFKIFTGGFDIGIKAEKLEGAYR